jgi:hypothetical protein
MKIKPCTCTSKKTGSRNERPLQIKNYSFKKVNNFIYLGAILKENNQMQFEIAERIQKQSLLCKCKTFKIKIATEKYKDENIS